MSIASPVRLLIYDATQASRPPRALGLSWVVGARLYGTLGWVDASFGAASFAEALDWLARAKPGREVSEVQFWGHGKWGRALIERESFDRSCLAPIHALRKPLEAVRERLAPDALVWFRTCETLGAHAGQDFARALGDFTGARVAGHTYEIGYWQSGLHTLAPGATPDWDPSEGLAVGHAGAPERALASRPDCPNTITCFTHQLPATLGQ